MENHCMQKNKKIKKCWVKCSRTRESKKLCSPKLWWTLTFYWVSDFLKLHIYIILVIYNLL